MTLELNWLTLITAAAVVGAIVALWRYFSKTVHWVDKLNMQDEEIRILKEENKIHTIGILACLKGLAEQGCDGPVHDAIELIEKHLNEGAHK